MSGNTILAPREDSDPAIDRAARGAAGGGVDRYRTWVSDYRVSAALLAGLIATHLATVVGYFMPGIGSVAGRAVPVRWHLPLRRRDCLHGRVRRRGVPALEVAIGHIR